VITGESQSAGSKRHHACHGVPRSEPTTSTSPAPLHKISVPGKPPSNLNNVGQLLTSSEVAKQDLRRRARGQRGMSSWWIWLTMSGLRVRRRNTWGEDTCRKGSGRQGQLWLVGKNRRRGMVLKTESFGISAHKLPASRKAQPCKGPDDK
jgi:hypothetical protein